MAQSVFVDVLQHLPSAPGEQRFGFLLGQRLCCPATKETYVLVDAIWTSAEPLSERHGAHYFEAALERATEVAERRGKVAVGWFHNHSTLMGVKLSEHDLRLHSQFFPEPWQCALLIVPHPLRPDGGFLQRGQADSYSGIEMIPFYEVVPSGPAKPGGALDTVVNWKNYWTPRQDVRMRTEPLPPMPAEPPEEAVEAAALQPADGLLDRAPIEFAPPELKTTGPSAQRTLWEEPLPTPVEPALPKPPAEPVDPALLAAWTEPCEQTLSDALAKPVEPSAVQTWAEPVEPTLARALTEPAELVPARAWAEPAAAIVTEAQSAPAAPTAGQPAEPIEPSGTGEPLSRILADLRAVVGDRGLPQDQATDAAGASPPRPAHETPDSPASIYAHTPVVIPPGDSWDQRFWNLKLTLRRRAPWLMVILAAGLGGTLLLGRLSDPNLPEAPAVFHPAVGPPESQTRTPAEFEALRERLANGLAAYRERRRDFDRGRIDCAGLSVGLAKVRQPFQEFSDYAARHEGELPPEAQVAYRRLTSEIAYTNQHFETAGCVTSATER